MPKKDVLEELVIRIKRAKNALSISNKVNGFLYGKVGGRVNF